MKIRRVLAAIMLLAPCAASAIDNPIRPQASTEDCRAEWARSTASRSCDAGVFGRPGLICRIQASCATSDGRRVESRYNLDYLQVRNLVNCNGHLKAGGC